mmetsp:Transcript_1550/g.3708  ORF Transcript_1550/g.3708 Transcript_1550/m.3708 type:complete len:194 (-) Transcript_1550:244-825(-)
MKSVLAALSPCRHPKRWFAINFFVLAWGAILLFYIIIYINRDEDDIDKTETEWNYLLYNFVACTVWCVEVMLNLLDFKGYFNDMPTTQLTSDVRLLESESEQDIAKARRKEEVALAVEFFLAVYFTVDSILLVNDGSRQSIHTNSKGMLWDVLLNTAAYEYIICRQITQMREAKKRSDNAIDERQDVQASEIV